MTAHEIKVAALIAAGLRDGEIAAELGISPRTVKEHKRRAARALGYRGKRLDVFLVRAVCGNIPSESRLQLFGPRLRRTAELVLAGLTNAEIAVVCRLSVETIRNDMREIFDRAGVWNRRELAGFLMNAEPGCDTIPALNGT